MKSAPARLPRLAFPVLAAGLCGGGVCAQTASTPSQAGSTKLPSTPATSIESPGHASSGSQSSARRPEVHYADGMLTVTARDASLNTILREIAQQTGMKISGGVRDDRVFGTYGPDRPSAVLTTLLDGSGSNMLLVNNAANEPAQLILSPRTGGPTPPNQFANGRQQDQEDDDAAAPQTRFGAQGFPRSCRKATGPTYNRGRT